MKLLAAVVAFLIVFHWFAVADQFMPRLDAPAFTAPSLTVSTPVPAHGTWNQPSFASHLHFNFRFW